MAEPAPAGRLTSLRRTLLAGILVPVIAFVVVNAFSLYRQALKAADTAYDRTLLASAKSIGEMLEVADDGGRPRLRSTVPYSALEAFEADNRSRMFFKVTGFGGEMVSGFEDLPSWRGELPAQNVYAALVHFRDAEFRGQPVRMAVLLQPVAGQSGQGMATIQVAETLELRHTLARALLIQTLWQQAALVALIAGVVVFVVDRATRPVRQLSAGLRERAEDDLSPLAPAAAPRELQPMVEATNAVMARLAHLLAHQKRFVRDASHQLRTPLAVLKTQLQSARRGDVEPTLALQEIAITVERATELANQMLALAKVEQLRQQGDAAPVEWSSVVRAVALDLSALIADAGLDFEIETQPVHVLGHEWALRELARNLLHNAIRHSPPGGRLRLQVAAEYGGTGGAVRTARLLVADDGPGIAEDMRLRLFHPFAAGLDSGQGTAARHGGSGLGLAICREIVDSLGGQIVLDNRLDGDRVTGLDARVVLPAAAPQASAPPPPTPPPP